MGYLHIPNLHADQTILMFKRCYASCKVHGTSAHVSYCPDTDTLRFFSGGAKHESFVALFDQDDLRRRLKAIVHPGHVMTFYGEAYGGKLQGMSHTYGKELKFIVFDVKVVERYVDAGTARDFWFDMGKAALIAEEAGLEFVPFRIVDATVEAIDAERDRPSEIAVRRGITEPKIREGVVLRPVVEMTLNSGARIIAKHKRAEFAEVRVPKPVDPERVEVMKEAQAVADQYVTVMRLKHVLDKFPRDMRLAPEALGKILSAFAEDVERESAGEAEVSKDARKLISGAVVKMVKPLFGKTVEEFLDVEEST